MQKIASKKENSNEEKVREYINKYIKELQRHFDMSDKTMRIILYRVYQELSPFEIVKIAIKKWVCMIKSKYQNFKKELKWK